MAVADEFVTCPDCDDYNRDNCMACPSCGHCDNLHGFEGQYCRWRSPQGLSCPCMLTPSQVTEVEIERWPDEEA